MNWPALFKAVWMVASIICVVILLTLLPPGVFNTVHTIVISTLGVAALALLTFMLYCHFDR